MFDGFRSVDDAVAVGAFHGVEDQQHHLDGARRRHAPLTAQVLGQAAALDVLEHQIGIAVLLAGVEDRHDVGMAQLADRARLVHQRLLARLVPALQVQRLDGDLALQVGVMGQVDDALRPGAENAEDVEFADFLRVGAGRLIFSQKRACKRAAE